MFFVAVLAFRLDHLQKYFLSLHTSSISGDDNVLLHILMHINILLIISLLLLTYYIISSTVDNFSAIKK